MHRARVSCVAQVGRRWHTFSSNGAAGLIDTLRDKVDTCMLHQLQRAVLWCLGKTGKTCKNPEAQEQLRKNARIVMLSRQSLGVNKEIKQLQREAGVSRHQVRTLVPSSQTRWGAEFEQVARNNLLRHAVEQSVDNFKRKNKGSMDGGYSRTKYFRSG